MFRYRQALCLVVLTLSRERSNTNLPVCIFIAFFCLFVSVCSHERFLSHFQYTIPCDAFFIQPMRHRIYLITVDNWCATFCYQLWISGISPSFLSFHFISQFVDDKMEFTFYAVEKKMSIMQELPIALHYITQHVMRWFYGHENNYCYSYLMLAGWIANFYTFFCLYIKNKKFIYDEIHSRVLFYVWKLCIKWYKFCAGFF